MSKRGNRLTAVAHGPLRRPHANRSIPRSTCRARPRRSPDPQGADLLRNGSIPVAAASTWRGCCSGSGRCRSPVLRRRRHRPAFDLNCWSGRACQAAWCEIAEDTADQPHHPRALDQDEYRFVPEGPAVSTPDELAACREAIVASDKRLSGRQRVAAARRAGRFLRRRRRSGEHNGARFVLDTSGAELRDAISAGGHIFLLKASREELDRGAAGAVVAGGHAEHVALTLGREGALLVNGPLAPTSLPALRDRSRQHGRRGRQLPRRDDLWPDDRRAIRCTRFALRWRAARRRRSLPEPTSAIPPMSSGSCPRSASRCASRRIELSDGRRAHIRAHGAPVRPRSRADCRRRRCRPVVPQFGRSRPPCRAARLPALLDGRAPFDAGIASAATAVALAYVGSQTSTHPHRRGRDHAPQSRAADHRRAVRDARIAVPRPGRPRPRPRAGHRPGRGLCAAPQSRIRREPVPARCRRADRLFQRRARPRPRHSRRRAAIPIWILGSSLFGAQLAAMLGLLTRSPRISRRK